MSTLKKRIFLLIITAVLLIPVAGYSVKISFYIGDVTLLRDGKKIHVRRGKKVQSGDVIKTGDGALVELIYSDNSKIIIQEKSIIRIGSKCINSESPSIILGRLTGKFNKVKKGKHKIYTPTAVCAIRGTEFDIGVSNSGDSKIDLKEGKVEVSNPNGTIKQLPGQNVEIDVASAPEKGSQTSIEDWRKNKDEQLNKNPEKVADKFNITLAESNKRSSKVQTSIEKFDKLVSEAKDKKSLVKADSQISATEEKIEDEIMLGEISGFTIENILKYYKNRNKNIYKRFKKIKEESNRVLQTKKKSYEDIQAVKEAHKKAYQNIMGSYNDEKKRIKDNTDLEGVKPEIKKYKVK